MYLYMYIGRQIGIRLDKGYDWKSGWWSRFVARLVGWSFDFMEYSLCNELSAGFIVAYNEH